MLAQMTTLIPLPAFSTAIALGVASALLSVFVVLRRWSFIGEGIAHSGFGGAGVAWMLALLAPGLVTAEQTPWIVSLCVIGFSLLCAVLIGHFMLSGRLNSDAVIGVFLVASLAFGFLAQHIYMHVHGRQPWGYDSIFLGNVLDVGATYAMAAVAISVAIVVTVAMMGKEILSYCLDPTGARVSGVRAPLVHYMLMLLVAITIIVGVRVAGALLITALVVLPGVVALLITRRIQWVITCAICAGLIGTLGGLLIHETWRFLPAGPAMALVLFIEFLVAYAFSRVSRPA